MPELPEVQTTVDGLNAEVKGQKILDVWTDYKSHFHRGKDNIKNPKYFETFRGDVIGSTITGSTRQGKNVLIHLSKPAKLTSTSKTRHSGPSRKTILVHMKMTGHFMYGEYVFDKMAKTWKQRATEGPLLDPYNKFIHLVFTLSP